MKKLSFLKVLSKKELHFKIQKDFHSIVSGLAKALRENDDAPDDDDDYGSHSGPRESGGRGAESPLPPPTLTHLPHQILAGTKAKAKPSPSNDLRLLLAPLDYYLPPWVSRPS